jgi:hypothetical protein
MAVGDAVDIDRDGQIGAETSIRNTRREIGKKMIRSIRRPSEWAEGSRTTIVIGIRNEIAKRTLHCHERIEGSDIIPTGLKDECRPWRRRGRRIDRRRRRKESRDRSSRF